VLEVVTKETIADSEVWWIAYGRALGWPLTNISAGGGLLGCSHTPQSKALLSASKTEFYRNNPAERVIVGARTKAWQKANPEETRRLHEAHGIQMKRFFEENPSARTRVREQLGAFFETNPDAREASNEKLRTFTQSERGRAAIGARVKAWHQANPGAAGAFRRAAYERNPSAATEQGARLKAFYRDNPDARDRAMATRLAIVSDPVRSAEIKAKTRAAWTPEKRAESAAKTKATKDRKRAERIAARTLTARQAEILDLIKAQSPIHDSASFVHATAALLGASKWAINEHIRTLTRAGYVVRTRTSLIVQ